MTRGKTKRYSINPKVYELRDKMKSHQPPMKNGSPDDFQTPEIALDVLIPFLNKDWIVWECAKGKGNLEFGLGKKGFLVHGTDILGGVDFLKNPLPNIKFDCIVTNPPYSLKEEFIARCYELGKPFALLMPLTALESEKRQKFWRKGIQLIIPNKRFNFETPSGKGSGSWFATAWFCGNMNLPKDLNFIELVRETSDKRTKEGKDAN